MICWSVMHLSLDLIKYIQIKKKNTNIITALFYFRSGGYTDSDTGATDPEGKSGKKKTKKERKKTANLGPRIKVLRIIPVETNTQDGNQNKPIDDRPDIKV